ncbi:Ribonuclease H domain [Sesbania bispinosa]|nr:Ribonuclease H domain [Sesbania bispinosa]
MSSTSIMNARITPTASIVWRSILKAKEFLHDGFRMEFQNDDTSIWYQDWTGLGPLCNILPFVHISNTQSVVKQLWNNGQWDFSSLYTPVPKAILHYIRTIPIPTSILEGSDNWCWVSSSSRSYCAKAGSEWLLNQHGTDPSLVFGGLGAGGIILFSIRRNGIWALCYCGHNRAMYTGGVLRDSSGTWICGCSSKEGDGTVLRAELLAILCGLLMAWDKGLCKVLCESDSPEVVHLLHLELIPESTPYKDLLLEIRNLLQKNWDVSLAHVVRETNYVADFLTKDVVAMAEDYTLWDAPPLGALPLLTEDCLF